MINIMDEEYGAGLRKSTYPSYHARKRKQKIKNSLLLKWHKEIFSSTKPDIAGKYREYGVTVGPYRAPDWQDVKKLMNNLIEFIEKNKIITEVHDYL